MSCIRVHSIPKLQSAISPWEIKSPLLCLQPRIRLHWGYCELLFSCKSFSGFSCLWPKTAILLYRCSKNDCLKYLRPDMLLKWLDGTVLLPSPVFRFCRQCVYGFYGFFFFSRTVIKMFNSGILLLSAEPHRSILIWQFFIKRYSDIWQVAVLNLFYWSHLMLIC